MLLSLQDTPRSVSHVLIRSLHCPCVQGFLLPALDLLDQAHSSHCPKTQLDRINPLQLSCALTHNIYALISMV